MVNDEEMRDKLLGVLRSHLTLLPKDEALRMDAALIDLGLDSMNGLNVMFDLEAAFEVSFPDSMLNPETFHSAATLEQAIRQLLAGA